MARLLLAVRVCIAAIASSLLMFPLLALGDEPQPKPKPFGDEAPKAVMTLVDAAGQPVVDAVDPGKMIVITTEMSLHDDLDGSLRWRIEGTEQVHVYPDKSAAVIVSELTDGLIRVQLIAARGGRSDDQVILIRVGHGPQPPPKPVIPVNPVDPVDPVTPPGPVTGLRVLVVYETEAKLTREQLNILNSTQLISLLNEKCVKGADGRAEWRKWDKTSIDRVGLAKESAVWQDLWKSVSPKLTTLPQIVIVTDQAATIHKFPATEAEAIALLTKINSGGK